MTPAALRLRAALLTVALASTAHAEGEVDGAWLTGGGYLGYGSEASRGAFGFGAEVSVMSWTHRDPFVGGFAQLGRVGGPHPYTRAALGAEVALLFFGGLELGAARLWLDDGRIGHQIAVAPYVSMGLATLSLRTGIPLDTAANALGVDGSLVLTIKFLPYPIGNPGPAIGAAHGRPFSCGSSSLCPRADWA